MKIEFSELFIQETAGQSLRRTHMLGSPEAKWDFRGLDAAE